MSKTKETAHDASNNQPEETSQYTIEQLGLNCLKLFGVTQSTFDGATNGMTGKHSIEGIKKVLKLWQKKEVK